MGLNKKEDGGKKDDKKGGGGESKISTAPVIPKEPPEIRNPEEKEIMDSVKAEYDKAHDTKAKKKKGKAKAKGKGKGDEEDEDAKAKETDK